MEGARGGGGELLGRQGLADETTGEVTFRRVP